VVRGSTEMFYASQSPLRGALWAPLIWTRGKAPGRETNLQGTSAESNLQGTSAQTNLQGTSAESNLQGTSAITNLQSTSAKTILQATSAETNPTGLYIAHVSGSTKTTILML